MRMRARGRTVLLCRVCAAASCGGPRFKKIANDWYVDQVEDGKPSPRLYWVKTAAAVTGNSKDAAALSRVLEEAIAARNQRNRR